MPSLSVDTEYSIHDVLHHPKIDCLPLPASLSSLCSQWTLLYSILYIPTIMSWPMNWVSAPFAPPSQSVACWGMASKPSSNPDRSWPPSASPNFLHHSLQVCMIMASERYLQTPLKQPPRSSLSSLAPGLQVHLQAHLITARKCISEFNPYPPPSASTILQDYSLQVHFWDFPLLTSKCVSKLACSPSLSTDHIIMVWWNSGPLMASEGNLWDRVVLAQGA